MRPLFIVIASEGVAISAEIPSPLTGEGQGEGESAGIAEPVPSKTRNPALGNDKGGRSGKIRRYEQRGFRPDSGELVSGKALATAKDGVRGAGAKMA